MFRKPTSSKIQHKQEYEKFATGVNVAALWKLKAKSNSLVDPKKSKAWSDTIIDLTG